MRRSPIAALVIALGFATIANLDRAVAGDPARPVPLQILAINDFHGHLEPPPGSSGRVDSVLAGGAEYLAAHLERARKRQKHTITVSSGDDIGGSPLISGLFHDEPTLEAFDLMKVEISSVGNHEFDHGPAELIRLAHGGCPPTETCAKKSWKGVKMTYLSANVRRERSGTLLFAPSAIRTFEKIPVAFIGLTLKETPSIVTKDGTAGLVFEDEVKTVNEEVARLRSRSGVHAFVILLHQGGFVGPGPANSCNSLTGPLSAIASRLDKDVDLILSAHTHQNYVCRIAGKPVSQSGSFGTVFADVRAALDPSTTDFASIKITNTIATRDIDPTAKMTRLVDKWRVRTKGTGDQVIGRLSHDVTRATTAAGESALGNLVTDAQLAAARESGSPLPQFAVTNPGGLRADLSFAARSATRQPGEITFGELFAAQPFANTLSTVTLSGVDVKTAFEAQFDNPAPGQVRVLQVSANVRARYDPGKPAGARVLSLAVDGREVVPTAKYRVTLNSFLASGGDAFAPLASGTDRVELDTDLGALVSYFRALDQPYAPPPLGRLSVG